MKYTYAYKTSDGTRHEASMNAESREAVFAALREQGIKAIKVVAADGSKANGEIRGVRKRVLAASVIVTALLAGLAVFFTLNTQQEAPSTTHEARGTKHEARPLTRQEILGDRARIEQSYASAFENAAERFLALFAEPGRPLPADFAKTVRPTADDFAAVLRRPLVYADTDLTETVDLKRIVEKIKADLANYLTQGGTVADYIDELVKRQEREIALRENAAKRLEKLLDSTDAADFERGLKTAYDFWLKANARLRSMGIYALPLPTQLRRIQQTVDLED